MKFDTRDIKPKVWSILIPVSIGTIIISILLILDSQRYAVAMCCTMAALCLTVISILLWAFREQIRYNPYSYNTIYYIGFALFVSYILITYVLLIIELIRYKERSLEQDLILHILLNSAKKFMFYTSPFLIIFSIALCISNISLIRHEGKRLVNILGIVLSFLIVSGLVFIFMLDFYASGSKQEVMIHDLFVNLFAAIYLYFECMLIGTIIAGAIAAKGEPNLDRDFLIILGCGIRQDGSPTPILQGRIDRALAFARKQKEMNGKEVTFVTSGGQGPDEIVSECESMKLYLIDKGIPEERILEENQSTNTFENMSYSKKMINSVNPNAKIAFSTTNYHVFRSGLFARRVKMRAVGVGSKTRWYFWPNAAVREFIGLLTEHRGKQALIFGSLIIVYIILTLIAYR